MDPTKLLNAISKYIQILNRSYQELVQNKKELMNNPKMMEYLFYHSINKKSNLKEAMEFVGDDTVKKVKLVGADQSQIEGMFLVLYHNTVEYQIDFERYLLLLAKYYKLTGNKLDLSKRLSFVPKRSTGINVIAKFLDSLSVDYIPQWSFTLVEQHLSSNKKMPYSFETDLQVDFYGYILDKKNKMIQYAIIYDESTANDYLAEYYLRQINIHLLRLNKKSDIGREIGKFFRIVAKTDKYLVRNGFNIDSLKDDVENDLAIFYKDYYYNHIIYLKYKKSDDELADLSDDDLVNYSEDPCDEGYVTNIDLSKRKYFFS